MQNNLENWAKEVAQKNGFKIDKEIYRGFYYGSDKLRNLIYSGIYNGKEAILKLYDDPRLSDEPVAQESFSRGNKSRIIFAPKIFKFDLATPKKGWLIMEKLSGGKFLAAPLKKEERANFLQLFVEYRKNFPQRPTRKLVLAESLPAHEFHLFRISRWLQLANDKEKEIVAGGEKSVLNFKKFILFYEKSVRVLRREFTSRRMLWCHGHFKPHEIFVTTQDKYYLTDFAHVKMYPDGYELAFIIWSDWLMGADWGMPYKKWRRGVFEWLEEMEPLAKKLGINNFRLLMRASLIERILGSILADICAIDRPREEKEKRLDLLFKLWAELLK